MTTIGVDGGGGVKACRKLERVSSATAIDRGVGSNSTVNSDLIVVATSEDLSDGEGRDTCSQRNGVSAEASIQSGVCGVDGTASRNSVSTLSTENGGGESGVKRKEIS